MLVKQIIRILWIIEGIIQFAIILIWGYNVFELINVVTCKLQIDFYYVGQYGFQALAHADVSFDFTADDVPVTSWGKRICFNY